MQRPTPYTALPGRSEAMPVNNRNRHFVNGNPVSGAFPGPLEKIVFGLGCFWGAERRFWQQNGVFSTAVGYIGGVTPNPTYDEVCTGLTGHNEAVLVVFDAGDCPLLQLLSLFWESHDPTQGMRQGNDIGSQYRSGIYCYTSEQLTAALHSRQHYQNRLNRFGKGAISTEIMLAPEFYYAEDYHQQYLAKNPAGYCGLGGTGIAYLD